MFFRKKKRDLGSSNAQSTVDVADNGAALEGTAPDVVEVVDNAFEAQHAPEETVSAAVIAPKSDDVCDIDSSRQADGHDTALATVGDDPIRLFPGFERDDFEVGFRADHELPALVMRWKEGGDWFCVPALFNRAVLAAMDERDSASDLNRLLRNYGYDVEAASEK